MNGFAGRGSVAKLGAEAADICLVSTVEALNVSRLGEQVNVWAYDAHVVRGDCDYYGHRVLSLCSILLEKPDGENSDSSVIADRL